MKELANKGNIEEEGLVNYIVDGISDDLSNKCFLYEAKTIRQLKDKLDVYETVKSKRQTQVKRTDQNKSPNERNRCFNCGSPDHKSVDCKDKAKGPKCFSCNEFGHRASDCPVKESNSSRQTTKRNAWIIVKPVRSKNSTSKIIVINSKAVIALIDTGSEVSLMKPTVHKRIGSPTLLSSNLVLTGIGRSKVQTLGMFQTKVEIDHETYLLRFYVVPEDSMEVEAVIGEDTLSQAVITIDEGRIAFQKATTASFVHLKPYKDETPLVNETSDRNLKSVTENPVVNYKPDNQESRKTTDVVMSKDVTENEPISQLPSRLPSSEIDIVEQQVKEWISEHASPVAITKKMNCSYRLCMDHRKINKIIVTALPSNEDLLDRLRNAKVFSTIDLRNRFFHVPVAEDRRKCTSLVTNNGACIDDLIIPSKEEEQETEHLKQSQHLKKCQFRQAPVEIVMDGYRIFTSQMKSKALQVYPNPKNAVAKQPVQIYRRDAEKQLHTDFCNEEYGAILLKKKHADVGVLEETMLESYGNRQKALHADAKMHIRKVQQENVDNFNRVRKKFTKYKVGELVAIKSTEIRGGLKLSAKCLGPYRIKKCKENDNYDVIKEGSGDGPINTTTCAEYMKYWGAYEDEESACEVDEVSETDTCQDGRIVGSREAWKR